MSRSRRVDEVLVECLAALDTNATIEDCLSSYPHERDALRPYLELRSHLSPAALPMPSAAAYQSGRERLLAHVVAGNRTSRAGRPAAAGWLRSPLGRAAAAGAFLLLLLAGGTLVASAAGVHKAHEVLATIHFPALSSSDQAPPPDEDADGASPGEDDTGAAPIATDDGQNDDGNGDDAIDDGSRPDGDNNKPNNGLGADHRKCKNESALQHTPVLRGLFTPCQAESTAQPPVTPDASDDDGNGEEPTNVEQSHGTPEDHSPHDSQTPASTRPHGDGSSHGHSETPHPTPPRGRPTDAGQPSSDHGRPNQNGDGGGGPGDSGPSSPGTDRSHKPADHTHD